MAEALKPVGMDGVYDDEIRPSVAGTSGPACAMRSPAWKVPVISTLKRELFEENESKKLVGVRGFEPMNSKLMI